MNTDNVLQAILLLCSYFNKSEAKSFDPLTPTEYSRLAVWLHQNGYTPADFLTRKEELLSQWVDPKQTLKKTITSERLNSLLGRAVSMGFALEKWQLQNVHILSRASKDYPALLKEALGDTRTPLLYAIGNTGLLKSQSIGFVGSRDIDADDEAFTQTLAQQAVEQGFTVISGGAKGIDQTSMIAALDAGGCAIGILADSLLKSATNPSYRTALKEGRLLLISPYYPESGFSVGTAMGRNKYIYALSKGVVVAKSAEEEGGTWSGATENLKRQWAPLWVRDIQQAGNQKLIELGGQPISGNKVNFLELQSTFSFEQVNTKSSAVSKKHESLKTANQPPEPEPNQSQKEEAQADLFAENTVGDTESNDSKETPVQSLSSYRDNCPHISEPLGLFLELFYQQLKQQKDEVFKPKALLEKYPELNETIIKKWLSTLEQQGLLERPGKKLEYRLLPEQ